MSNQKRGNAASGILRLIDGGKNDNTEAEREGIINLTEWKRKKKKEKKREDEGEVIKVA